MDRIKMERWKNEINENEEEIRKYKQKQTNEEIDILRMETRARETDRRDRHRDGQIDG